MLLYNLEGQRRSIAPLGLAGIHCAWGSTVTGVESQDDDRGPLSDTRGSAVSQPALRVPSTPRSPLLDTANPARLSRTEFRICLLLSQGLNLSSVGDELEVSPATLKAHIRRILLKTGARSFAELLARLIGPNGHGPGASSGWPSGQRG